MLFEFLKKYRKFVAVICVALLIAYGVKVYFSYLPGKLTFEAVKFVRADGTVFQNRPFYNKGEAIHFISEVTGFARTKQQAACFTEDIVLRSPDNDVLFAEEGYQQFREIAHDESVYLESKILLPPNKIAAGEYKLLIRLHDDLRKEVSTSTETSFRISEDFHLNLHHFTVRSSEGDALKGTPVVAEEALVITGELTGFKLDEKSLCNLRGEYSISDSDGDSASGPQQLFDIKQQVDRSVRSLLLNEQIQIPETLLPETYVLHITITDFNQNKELRRTFSFRIE